MRLCLHQHNKQVLSEWEALTTLLGRLSTIDGTIVLYPWKSMDQSSQPAIRLLSASSVFLNLQTYAPELISFKWLDKPTQQLSLLLGSTISPAILAQKIGPWLHTTKQGLWP